MSQSDNLYSEISKTRPQFNTLLAGYWKSGIRPVIVNLGTFSDGTRYQVVDQYRDSKFYLVTGDISAQPFGFDTTLPTFTAGGHSSLTRHIVVEALLNNASVALNVGTQVKIVDTAGANQLAIDTGNRASVRGTRASASALANDFLTVLPGSDGLNSTYLVTDVNGYLLASNASLYINALVKFQTPAAFHITTNATTNVTAADAWISSVVITTDAAGTGSTITIQDKSATPKKLINGLATTALSTLPNVLSLGQSPLLMTGGIDIVTAGAVAATIDVWITYWQ